MIVLHVTELSDLVILLKISEYILMYYVEDLSAHLIFYTTKLINLANHM